MVRLLKRVLLCLLVVCLFCAGALLGERRILSHDLIRVHVVANSDGEEDQQIKLRVIEAVMESLKAGLKEVQDVEAAIQYLQENLPKLQTIANNVLLKAGVEPSAVVSFCAEAFGARYSEAISLPAGIYNTLRITIGQGKGENWWGVVFPEFYTTEIYSALETGLMQGLAGHPIKDNMYEVRFFFLDVLGRIDKIIFRS